jgi:hypothetical protein
MENVIPCCHEIIYFSTANKAIFKLIRFRRVLCVCMLTAVFHPKAETGVRPDGSDPGFLPVDEVNTTGTLKLISCLYFKLAPSTIPGGGKTCRSI